MTNDTAERFPWEPAPAPTIEDEIAFLKRDFAYAVRNTAIKVHSNNEKFLLLANSPRGQMIPRNEVKFSDGTTVEFQDIGMCQPGLPYMTVPELLTAIVQIATELKIEIVK